MAGILRRRTRTHSLVLACLIATAAPVGATDAAARSPYCFSDICLDDPPRVMAGVTLDSLGRIAERALERSKDYAADLKAALPALSDADRSTLAAYTDSSGGFLIDARSLPIFLGIDKICGPVDPFVAVFRSESGHLTSLQFQAVAVAGEVRLGVTRIARSFNIKPGSVEEKVLIADLSDKFGYRMAEAPEKEISHGVTARFERHAAGLQLSFTRVGLPENAPELREQAGCSARGRVNID